MVLKRLLKILLLSGFFTGCSLNQSLLSENDEDAASSCSLTKTNYERYHAEVAQNLSTNDEYKSWAGSVKSATEEFSDLHIVPFSFSQVCKINEAAKSYANFLVVQNIVEKDSKKLVANFLRFVQADLNTREIKITNPEMVPGTARRLSAVKAEGDLPAQAKLAYDQDPKTLKDLEIFGAHFKNYEPLTSQVIEIKLSSHNDRVFLAYQLAYSKVNLNGKEVDLLATFNSKFILVDSTNLQFTTSNIEVEPLAEL